MLEIVLWSDISRPICVVVSRLGTEIFEGNGRKANPFAPQPGGRPVTRELSRPQNDVTQQLSSRAAAVVVAV